MGDTITLLSDFGTRDTYVGQMKGVILSIFPQATLVDITHEVERFNVRMGAFLLASATPRFHPGTVHLAVVDPGVGGARRPIAVETRRSIYVGPDNGLLIPAAKREGIRRVFHLTNASLMLNSVSPTFHGRDIFAPVAAHLAAGISPNQVGEELTDFVELAFGEPEFAPHEITCEAIHIDRFGNVITNISEENASRLRAKGKFIVSVRRKKFQAKLVDAYFSLGRNQLGLVVGSHGFLEIAGRESDASRKIRAGVGDRIRIAFR